MAKDRHQLNISMKGKLFEKVSRKAEAEDESLSRTAHNIIEKYVAEHPEEFEIEE